MVNWRNTRLPKLEGEDKIPRCQDSCRLSDFS